jgi:16S rRNA (cytidine1402-2'-O)-methyltransferase
VSLGKLIIAANHSGDPSDIPAKTIQAIKETKHIFCDHLWLFKKDVVNFHSIDISDKAITEVGHLTAENDIANLIIEVLKAGQDVVFITDHGLPGFADKGVIAIGGVYSQGVDIKIIPGPTIAGLAIAIAGISSTAEEYYAMSIFDYEFSNKVKKFEKLKDFPSNMVVLCHPEEVAENLNIASEIFSSSRWAAVCIDIGLNTQKIIRGSIGELQKHNLNLEDCATCIVFQGSLNF